MTSKSYDITESDRARLKYARARNKVKTLVRRDKRNFEKNIAMNAKAMPKKFWCHARRKLKTKPGIAPLLEKEDDKNSLRFDDKSKANILQGQFTKVFTKETGNGMPKLNKRCEAMTGNLHITEEMVKKSLKELNPHKSCGPDGIHAKILFELAEVIAPALTALYNQSLTQRRVPKDWKSANITPIFKKGSKNKAGNYRPISLTSIVCRIMESFIKNAILKHLLENNLLSPRQHGFISGRSTITQLLDYLNKCAKATAEGYVTDVIYLDFMKAFDTVPHQRLLIKLKSYGIDGIIKEWIVSYLYQRTQVVVVNGVESVVADVLSGIPQGTVLGPLLFVIYINDLLDSISSDGLMFADDTKIFRIITSKEDALDLQADIDSLEEWSNKWLLRFHPDKCHILSIGKFENIKHTERYKICGKEIEHVFEEKDLGIVFDHELTFNDHICDKVRKANAIMGLIRRSFTFLDPKTFTKLYTSFVRPHMEYGQSVWSPHLVKHKNMIENVQIRATKLVDGFDGVSYSDRLQKLNLPTLAYRRLRGDMIETFKHINKYDHHALSVSFNPRNRPSRQHPFQLIQEKTLDGTRGVLSNSFYHRIVKGWNKLPIEVVNAKSVNSFKNKLDDHWNNMELKFNHEATCESES